MINGSSATLPGLAAMVDELRAAPAIFRPSAFWLEHAERLDGWLETEGFDEFKRTLNRHFFQFMVRSPRDPQFRAAFSRWIRHPARGLASARLEEPLDLPPGRLPLAVFNRTYASYIWMLAEYVRRCDTTGIFAGLEEPDLGHPYRVRHRGRLVSEDSCNSALEYLSIRAGIPMPPGRVIELGSGYGRLAWMFLRLLPGVRYILVDIPPGLAIAQRYLSELFPDRRIFGFRHFERHAEAADELASADIAFLTPNQLGLLEPLGADLFVNISSLHEMRHEQIEHYFELIDVHCTGFFYTKQWLRSVNPFDDLLTRREDYPVGADWRVVFDRVHPIQTGFFEALYALPPSAPGKP